MSDAPAAPCALVESTWVVTTGSPDQSGFPRTMVLTAYFVLSPVTGLFCHRRLTDIRRIPTRLGGCTSARLDTSVGVSGPHDFAVRDLHRSSACWPIAHGKPALRSPLHADAVASTASRPASVTIASRPSGSETVGINKAVSTKPRSEIFFESGLDTDLLICPTGCLRAKADGRP